MVGFADAAKEFVSSSEFSIRWGSDHLGRHGHSKEALVLGTGVSVRKSKFRCLVFTPLAIGCQFEVRIGDTTYLYTTWCMVSTCRRYPSDRQGRLVSRRARVDPRLSDTMHYCRLE